MAALTIAVPYYSGLGYLELALASARAQEDPDWELVVFDDSPEKHGARELVERLEDARLRYVANPANLGMVACWNRCLDDTEGQLVTLLHADDRLLPGYVGLMKQLAAAHSSSVALFCAARTIDAAGRPCRSLQDDIKRFFVPRGRSDIVLTGEHGLRALMRGNFVFTPSICWRRSLLGTTRFDPRWKQVQDLDLHARLLLGGETYAGSRSTAYEYRRHEANATARQTESLLRFQEEYRVFDLIADAARDRGWRAAERTSRRKAIVKLHLAWRITREVAGLRFGAAQRYLRFLLDPPS